MALTHWGQANDLSARSRRRTSFVLVPQQVLTQRRFFTNEGGVTGVLQQVNLTVEGGEVVAQLRITLGMEPTRVFCVKDDSKRGCHPGRLRSGDVWGALVHDLAEITAVRPL